MTAAALWETLDGYLEKMITQQRAKVLRIARELQPGLTPEDIMNPQDYPKLVGDQLFNYEDGLLAGLISAQIAMRAEYRRKLADGEGA